MIEQFANELTAAVRSSWTRRAIHAGHGAGSAALCAPDRRQAVSDLPVLSHIEISRGVRLEVMASLS